MKPYFVYIVLCADKTFYTGVCVDLTKRMAEHNGSAKGAKYTRTRRPVSLVYSEVCEDRSQAQKREYALRTLSRAEKIRLTS